MNAFESIQDKVLANFSEWIQINDPKSNWAIEDFPYETGINEDITKPHCWKCVTVNQCWFKNENGKKPQKFDYSQYSLIDIPMSKRGLYHPNCHCKKNRMSAPQKEKKYFDNLAGKTNFFFKDKINWFYAWGYKDNDKESFINTVLSLTYESYTLGRYENIGHNKQGFKINIFIDLPGKHEKQSHIYKVKTCWMIFPNGKLKCNTLIGGRAK